MSNKKILNKKYIFLQNLFYAAPPANPLNGSYYGVDKRFSGESIPVYLSLKNKDNMGKLISRGRRGNSSVKENPQFRKKWVGFRKGEQILYRKNLSLLQLPPALPPATTLGVVNQNKNLNLYAAERHANLALLSLKKHLDGKVFNYKTNLITREQLRPPSLIWFPYKKGVAGEVQRGVHLVSNNSKKFKAMPHFYNPVWGGGLWAKSINPLPRTTGATPRGCTEGLLAYGTPISWRKWVDGYRLRPFKGYPPLNAIFLLFYRGYAPITSLNNNKKSWENIANYEIKLQNTKDELKVSIGLRTYLPLYFLENKKYIAETRPESQSILRFGDFKTWGGRDIGKAHGQFHPFKPTGVKTLPYKKSFFCYWLLPFMGFVSCFTSLPKDSFITPSLSLRRGNKEFLNWAPPGGGYKGSAGYMGSAGATLSTANLWSNPGPPLISSPKDLENKAINLNFWDPSALTLRTNPGGLLGFIWGASGTKPTTLAGLQG
jgi:hypothetical protein